MLLSLTLKWKFLKNTRLSHPPTPYICSMKHSVWLLSQFSSVSQSRPTLWDPMNCSMPSLPVQHQLPESIQTHVHWVSDAIQPSHPLSSPSHPALNHPQHQSLFQWVSSSHQVAKVLEFQLQYLTPISDYSQHYSSSAIRVLWNCLTPQAMQFWWALTQGPALIMYDRTLSPLFEFQIKMKLWMPQDLPPNGGSLQSCFWDNMFLEFRFCLQS